MRVDVETGVVMVCAMVAAFNAGVMLAITEAKARGAMELSWGYLAWVGALQVAVLVSLWAEVWGAE